MFSTMLCLARLPFAVLRSVLKLQVSKTNLPHELCRNNALCFSFSVRFSFIGSSTISMPNARFRLSWAASKTFLNALGLFPKTLSLIPSRRIGNLAYSHASAYRTSFLTRSASSLAPAMSISPSSSCSSSSSSSSESCWRLDCRRRGSSSSSIWSPVLLLRCVCGGILAVGCLGNQDRI